MIRIHLVGGSYADTSRYNRQDALAAIADGADLELTDPQYAGEPLGCRLIGHQQVVKIEELQR